MKMICKLVLIMIVAVGSQASAQVDFSEKAIEAFWKNPVVLARVESVGDAGFTSISEKPVVIPKHYYSGSFGVQERAFLVSQIIRMPKSGRLTNISAVVAMGSTGNVVSTDVIDFVRVLGNDVNGGLDEN